MLDLALASGTPPFRLLDEGVPGTWSDTDLEIVSQWRTFKETKCPGCGRPLSQHLHNPFLGREETVEDYMPYSMDCPAQQAIALGQEMWSKENKSAIKAYQDGNGPDPAMGLYWLSQGKNESLPTSPEQ